MKPIRTRVGRAWFDDYDHHGLRLYRDLGGRTSYLGLIAFSITGQRLTREDEALLDDLAVASHVPEPRVWPMKITRVAGSLGRAMPAFLCGSVVLDSDLLGGSVTGNAARLLVALRDHLSTAAGDPDDAVAAFLETRQRVAGFGVPFRPVDERVLELRRALERRGRSGGVFWQVGERLWRVARERRRLEVNIVGAMAALLLDLGLTPDQIPPMAAVLLSPTLLANAVEAAAQPSAALRRLPDEVVRYVGPAARKSPKARADDDER